MSLWIIMLMMTSEATLEELAIGASVFGSRLRIFSGWEDGCTTFLGSRSIHGRRFFQIADWHYEFTREMLHAWLCGMGLYMEIEGMDVTAFE